MSIIQFDLPKDQSSIIKVIGVGGGGSNAVNHMFAHNIDGVDFIICNTDAQALAQSNVPNKIQLGPQLTAGLGAGANPNIGRQATEESLEEIKKILEVNTKMAFITAGMGGGTGTGGAPILSKICQEMGILTVGIVTTPFSYEGKKRVAQAEDGIRQMKDYVDTLLVISNDKVRHQYGNLKVKEAFSKADDVLATAAKCITDVINSTGQINVDFADVCTVMRNGGVAILGSATGEGEHRAQQAIEDALNSPLLNDNDIHGAKWVLININSAEGQHEFTMDEVEIIQNHLIAQSGPDSDVILGLGYDNTLGDKISVTLIATGFEHKDPFAKAAPLVAKKEEKIVMTLDMGTANGSTPKPNRIKADVEEKAKEESTLVDDPMMPMLTEYKSPELPFEPSNASHQQDEVPIMFDLSTETKEEIVHFFEEVNATPTKEEEVAVMAVVNANSGGFLKKPAQIYVEEKKQEVIQPVAEAPSNEQEPAAEPFKLIIPEEPAMEMTLIEKEELEIPAPPIVKQPVQTFSMPAPEDTVLQEENEELRRRAQERINKLRSLSFNINASDPNNEFDTVPAYLRRSVDMTNQIADVENFYSNYTVKSDGNNQVEISTINTFLDGKKPD